MYGVCTGTGKGQGSHGMSILSEGGCVILLWTRVGDRTSYMEATLVAKKLSFRVNLFIASVAWDNRIIAEYLGYLKGREQYELHPPAHCFE